MDPLQEPGVRVTRRGWLTAGASVVLAGVGIAVSARELPKLFPELGTVAAPPPQAYCADPTSLVSRASVGRARLVYEVEQRASSFRFDADFHRQVEAWLVDWEKTNPHGNVGELWTYGAHVAKDECRSWHAAGRALDFSRLRRGQELLVSCRTDLWGGVDEARRAELVRRYWRLAASLNIHFEYVLTHHFDELHANHIHVDNGVSGAGLSSFHPGSRTQNQSVQAICQALWGIEGQVTGEWKDTRRMVAGPLDELGLSGLDEQQDWHAFLRASITR